MKISDAIVIAAVMREAERIANLKSVYGYQRGIDAECIKLATKTVKDVIGILRDEKVLSPNPQ